MTNDEIAQQWAQDVADYGEAAYLMWQEICHAQYDCMCGGWQDCRDNAQVQELIDDELYSHLHRKDSAALHGNAMVAPSRKKSHGFYKNS